MKLVCGVGINDADYVQQVYETVGYVDGKQKRKQVWVCTYYRVWVDMLNRSYNKKFKSRRPTYKYTSVCKEWHLFSTFKAWMEKQDWKGNQLDKDLLFPENSVYGPETCVFVSRQVNMFLVDSSASRGEWMIGVYSNKQKSKFVAQCCNPFTKKREYLGYFNSELEAHSAWLKRKLEHAYALAAIQTDERVAKALIGRYENYTTSSYF